MRLGGIPRVSGSILWVSGFLLLFKIRVFLRYVSDTYQGVSEEYPYPIRYPILVREFCEVSVFHRLNTSISLEVSVYKGSPWNSWEYQLLSWFYKVLQSVSFGIIKCLAFTVGIWFVHIFTYLVFPVWLSCCVSEARFNNNNNNNIAFCPKRVGVG